MAKRYEIPDAAWELVADIFTEHRRTGRPRTDDRLMPNGVLWVLLRRGLAGYARAFWPMVNGLSAVQGLA